MINLKENGPLNRRSRAFDTRGFTLSVYIKCLEYCENILPPRQYSGPQARSKGPAPYLRKRWLRPENCTDLASLLVKGQLCLDLITPMSSNIASRYNVVKLFKDPAVDLSWPIALIKFSMTDMIAHNALCIEILLTAFKRLDMTGDQLDQLYSEVVDCLIPADQSIISTAAYNSRNREVIQWAINRGLGPSYLQLRTMLGS